MDDNLNHCGVNQEPTTPLSSALFAALPSWSAPPYNGISAFPPRILAGEIPVNEETRKLAITIAAAIFAATALKDWDGKRSPRLVAGVANAIEKAKFLVSALEVKP